MTEIVQNHTNDVFVFYTSLQRPVSTEYTVMEKNYSLLAKHSEEPGTSLNFLRLKRLKLRLSNLKMGHRIPNAETLVSAYAHPVHPMHVLVTTLFFLVKVDTRTMQSHVSNSRLGIWP
jgi:hypothetical protein